MSKVHEWFKGNDKKPFNKMLVLYWTIGIAVVCAMIYFIILMNTSYTDINSEVVLEIDDQGEFVKTADSISLKDTTMDEFNKKYGSTDVEFIYCLYGHLEDGTYNIDKVTNGKSNFESDRKIRGGCVKSKNYLGLIHSHPKGTCQLSTRDLFAFGETFANDKTQILGVMCGEDRFSFYTPDSLRVPLDLGIAFT